MSETTMTCALVDERDLDTRYLAGTLDPAEAEEFEAHYFGCDRCWALVREGAAVRATLAESAPALVASKTPVFQFRPRFRRTGLAIAASIALLTLGLYRLTRPHPPAPDDSMRGDEPAIQVVTAIAGDSLAVNWSPVSGARSYRLRLFTSEGGIIMERELADTTVVVPLSGASGTPRGRESLLELLALDDLHRPLARSALTHVTLPQP